MKKDSKNSEEKKPFKKKKFQETKRGIVILYTGEGKGKTTASLGLALRAAGYKRKVLIVQFGKIWFTGELEGVKMLKPYVKIVQGGLGFVKLFDDTHKFEDHVKMAQKTYELLYKEVLSDKWDVVIADEIVGAIAGKVLKFEQVKRLIKEKPERLDLVLTGHHAKKNLIALADTATEMTQLKHIFQKGFLAKPGVDY
jgi:cob(I)alamin adenosyltransferase